MYNYLRGRLRQLGYQNKDLAPVLGIGAASVSHRMTGRQPWSLDEMYKLLDLCGDTPENLHLYFPRGGYDQLNAGRRVT